MISQLDLEFLHKKNPKLLIIGVATCGKDTVGELLETYGFKCCSSSAYATTKIMMPYFESIGKPYTSAEDCHNDRMNHRSVWYQQIEAYNSPTWNRVTRELFDDGFSVYLGMRSETELEASKDLYDLIVWIDASKRVGIEDTSSCTVTRAHADYILDNNGSLIDLQFNVKHLVEHVVDMIKHN